MNTLITAAFNRSKVVQLLLVFLLAVGTFAYTAIP
ncbi:MAG: multidrug efflux pump, partial [Paracoccaceae bacterium]